MNIAKMCEEILFFLEYERMRLIAEWFEKSLVFKLSERRDLAIADS